MTPEEARKRLDEKLNRFLEEHDKAADDDEAPPPEGDEDGDGS